MRHSLLKWSAFIAVSIGLFTERAVAQFGGRAGPRPSTNAASGPIMPATVARQSALPLVAPPVSPILGRHLGFGRGVIGFGGYGGYGGFYPYYPSYGYSQPNIFINNNYTFPEPYIPPRNFAVPEPIANSHPNSARLSLTVPTGAEIYLGGKKADSAGTQQTFESPELKPGEIYTFDVRVTWKENGKVVEEKRTLTMKAGEHQSLQYLALPPTPVRVDR